MRKPIGSETGFNEAILALAAGSVGGAGISGFTMHLFGTEATFLGAGLFSLPAAVALRSMLIR